MKIGIITFHFVNNFGGALQAYALRKVVTEQCKVETEIIDYRNWFIRLTDFVRIFPISCNFKEIVSGLKTMPKRIARKRKFNQFVQQNNPLSRRYNNRWQIKKHIPDDDKYICGSDQIWNPLLTMGIVPTYYMAFEKDSGKKIAYAPSFGTDGIAKCFEKTIASYVMQIGHLSVREKSGQELIKRLTGRDAVRLIDPAFLLNKEQWGEIAVPPMQSEPYILLYIMQKDDEVYSYVKEIKEQKKIKIVEISRYGYKPKFVDESLVDIGPAEFLGLFQNAEYVCTNSYHGLAYSLIFEKDFCLVPCKRFRARIDNMLELLQIDLTKSKLGDAELTAAYDKEFVRNTINKEKEKAISYLVRSVDE